MFTISDSLLYSASSSSISLLADLADTNSFMILAVFSRWVSEGCEPTGGALGLGPLSENATPGLRW